MSYLRVCDVKLKQHQLSHVFEFNIRGINALLNLCVTLIEKQSTELDSFLEK